MDSLSLCVKSLNIGGSSRRLQVRDAVYTPLCVCVFIKTILYSIRLVLACILFKPTFYSPWTHTHSNILCCSFHYTSFSCSMYYMRNDDDEARRVQQSIPIYVHEQKLLTTSLACKTRQVSGGHSCNKFSYFYITLTWHACSVFYIIKFQIFFGIYMKKVRDEMIHDTRIIITRQLFLSACAPCCWMIIPEKN